jgi:predicted Zn-ribbon and HTH transcriptional regulator
MLLANHKLAAGEKKLRPELADIFRQYGESYRKKQRLPASQQKVMRAISVCRTQELGGHLDRCDSCGFERPAYNSCRNRHCPKCQSHDRILAVHHGQVTVSYRDRKDGDRKKTIILDAQEFIRRFLLHVLPEGFMRIRAPGIQTLRNPVECANFRSYGP